MTRRAAQLLRAAIRTLRPIKPLLLAAAPRPLARRYQVWARSVEFDPRRFPKRDHPRGVNIVGYLRSESGVGESARSMAKSARAAGMPFSLFNAAGIDHARQEDSSAGQPDLHHPYDVNLFCVNAYEMATLRERLGGAFFAWRRSVGYWYWEVPPFPPAYRDRFEGLAEIWTASAFVADILRPVSPVPVATVAPPVEPRFSSLGRRQLGLSEGEFLFLAMADAGSFFERKNPEGAIEAFARAFRPGDGVRLVLKINNPTRDASGVARLRALAEGKGVEVLDRVFSREEIDGLLNACDAFVSLHRAEGFGLPCAEAMALGKPVVATDYSGTREFLDTETGFPVPYRLAELSRAVCPYAAGGTWAEPDLDAAAALLRRVVEDRTEAFRRAQAGARRMREGFGLGPAGQRLARQLEIVRSRP
jgi:glycosyltransferase involved in cell wall biosynthesis